MGGLLGVRPRFLRLRCFEGMQHLVCHFGKNIAKVAVRDRENLKGEAVYLGDLAEEICAIYERMLAKLENPEA